MATPGHATLAREAGYQDIRSSSHDDFFPGLASAFRARLQPVGLPRRTVDEPFARLEGNRKVEIDPSSFLRAAISPFCQTQECDDVPDLQSLLVAEPMRIGTLLCPARSKVEGGYPARTPTAPSQIAACKESAPLPTSSSTRLTVQSRRFRAEKSIRTYAQESPPCRLLES